VGYLRVLSLALYLVYTSPLGDIMRYSKYRPRPLLDSISINDYVVQPSTSARNLGFVVDNSLTLEEHVNSLTKSAFFHLRRVAKIREYLSKDSTAALVHAFVTCRLDNGKALLYGLPNYLLQPLQSVQNFAALVDSRKSRYARTSPILRELHWLPVENRIIFKILLLVYKPLNNLTSVYISDLLNYYRPSRNLRSVDQGLLTSEGIFRGHFQFLHQSYGMPCPLT